MLTNYHRSDKWHHSISWRSAATAHYLKNRSSWMSLFSRVSLILLTCTYLESLRISIFYLQTCPTFFLLIYSSIRARILVSEEPCTSSSNAVLLYIQAQPKVCWCRNFQTKTDDHIIIMAPWYRRLWNQVLYTVY